jgi:hypothetical protein
MVVARSLNKTRVPCQVAWNRRTLGHYCETGQMGQVEGDSTKTEWGWRVVRVWVYGGLPQALVVITAVETMFRVQTSKVVAGFEAVLYEDMESW